MNKCIFLDRDGVLNREVGSYVFEPEKFEILDGVKEALTALKAKGYMLIVVTNQSGIAKGLYSRQHVYACHEKLQKACDYLIDDLYFCPHHEDYDTASLLKKPDSLMLEKAMAKHNISPKHSYIVGDQPRDLEAGNKVGLNTIGVNISQKNVDVKYLSGSLLEAVAFVN
jgi:D-glycero-D-manno-heptose 1,7-bisphosphate phosphatase